MSHRCGFRPVGEFHPQSARYLIRSPYSLRARALTPRELLIALSRDVPGHRLAEVGLLSRVPVSWITEIRYVRGAVAVGRYGGDHAGGVILVTTSRR
jgi:hypothetical protein